MAIKFNHVTNTISFTSGACSASFVDSSATGIFETTGYARNCYITTGQTGNFVTASQTGDFITTGQTGAFGGGGGGGTTLPNGSAENSALCWNGSAWIAAETYVATGQTGQFSAFDLDFINCNIDYRCGSNIVQDSTGSSIFQGNQNCILNSIFSQINNGSGNNILTGRHNYIENGCENIICNNNIFSSVLNGCCNRIANSSCYVSIANGVCNTINAGIIGGIINSCCSIICAGTASSILGGGCNCNCFSSRSVIVGGQINFLCSSSTDSSIVGGSSHGAVGAFNSVLIGGSTNRLCHASTNTQTGNIIIGGCNNRIGGCFVTSHNAIINSLSSCICSGTSNVLIGGFCSCLMTGSCFSTIIGPRNIVCCYTGAVVIGSGITANANNTLFTNNLCVFGSIAGTGVFVTTGQTGSFAYVKCPSSPAAGCVICYDGTNWVAGTSAGGGGGTTLPNGTSANSALCWNGTAWVAAQTYVRTGQTGEYETTGYARRNYVSTGAGYLPVKSVAENICVNSVSGASGTLNFDFLSGSFVYYVCPATANFILNFRGSSNCTFNSLFPINNSVSASFVTCVDANSYCLSCLTIDNTCIPIKWAGGGSSPVTEPFSYNSYSITVVKTGVSTAHWIGFGSVGFYQ